MGPLSQILAELKGAPPRQLSHTLYHLIVEAILEGRLAHGLRLSSSRQLGTELGISRNTVINVYDRLMVEGYISPRRGLGFFVTHDSRKGRPRNARICDEHYRRHVAPAWKGVEMENLSKDGVVFDLLPGVPDTRHFPAGVWRRMCARAARRQRFGEQA